MGDPQDGGGRLRGGQAEPGQAHEMARSGHPARIFLREIARKPRRSSVRQQQPPLEIKDLRAFFDEASGTKRGLFDPFFALRAFSDNLSIIDRVRRRAA